MESLQVHLRFIVGKLTHGLDERRNSEVNLGSRQLVYYYKTKRVLSLASENGNSRQQ